MSQQSNEIDANLVIDALRTQIGDISFQLAVAQAQAKSATEKLIKALQALDDVHQQKGAVSSE